MKFLDIIRQKSVSTAADLAEALTEARAAATGAETKVEQLVAERARLLLDGDDRQLDSVERSLTTAQRDADRAALAIEELTRRLAAASAAERQAELDSLHAQGKAAFDRAAQLIGRDYSRLTAPLVKLLGELTEHYNVIAAVNEKLASAGDVRHLADPDLVARPRSPHSYLPIHFLGMVRLPSVAEPDRLLWPTDLDANGIGDTRPRPAK